MQTFHDIGRRFERIGARAQIAAASQRELAGSPLVIDIQKDHAGEYFDIKLLRQLQLRVVDTQPGHRHLLLEAATGGARDRLLCGHDEMHWFVAALPGASRAASVAEAKNDLKPELVQTLDNRRADRLKHRRSDYFRQGEWFFVPCRHAPVIESEVRSRAALRRGGGKPHLCQWMFEEGERRYACRWHPKEVTADERDKILATRRKSHRWDWRQVPFEPTIYVRGTITHPDHAPLLLDVWHRVERNTEPTELAVRHLTSVVRVRWRD